MTTKALIAEDEPLLAAEIREELARVWPELDVVATAHDGHEAWRAIDTLAPEVLFLDVQMPGLNGLELARLAGTRAHIVFITAFNHFAVQAFDEGAVDYLVKPLDTARLARAVRRVKERLGQAPADLRSLVERVQLQVQNPNAPLRWMTVQQGRDLRLIAVDEICYFQADHKYVTVVTAEGQALISTPLKELLPRLDAALFWQVHRGTIVNVNAVRGIVRGLGGRLSLVLKERSEKLPVSSTYAHLFKQW
jgi:DNA-binding LytR/AlgR family response regulator